MRVFSLLYIPALCAAILFARACLCGEDDVEPLKELPRGALAFSGAIPDVVLEKFALSPDGAIIAAAGSGGKIILFDARSAKQTAQIDAGGACAGIDFSMDGRNVFTAGPGTDVVEFDVESKKVTRKFSAHAHEVRAVSASPDGARLASSDAFGTLIIWDVKTASAVFTLNPTHYPDDPPAEQTPAEGLVFCPDGRNVITEAMDVKARVWDAVAGKELRMIPNHDGSTAAVSASPNGDLAASTRSGGILRLWQISTGRVQRVISGHQGDVTCSAFAPDGESVFSGAGDGTIRQWDVESGVEIRRFKLPAAPTALAVSPNGRRLYSLAPGAGVVVWDLSVPPLSDGSFSGSMTSLPNAWLALGSQEQRARADAVAYFLGYPDQSAAIRCLLEKLHPAEMPDENRRLQEELIKNLDSADYAQRSRAYDELQKMGQAARSLLLEALKNPSSEVRVKAGELLSRIVGVQDARVVLAVDILAWMHSPEARAALTGLSLREGQPEAVRAANALHFWER